MGPPIGLYDMGFEFVERARARPEYGTLNPKIWNSEFWGRGKMMWAVLKLPVW